MSFKGSYSITPILIFDLADWLENQLNSASNLGSKTSLFQLLILARKLADFNFYFQLKKQLISASNLS